MFLSLEGLNGLVVFLRPIEMNVHGGFSLSDDGVVNWQASGSFMGY